MNKTNAKGFKWAWYDDESVYVNQDKSLKAIIENVIEYYTDCECNAEQENDELIITFANDYDEIAENSDLEFEIDGDDISFKIKANGFEVARFLETIAECLNRSDRFDISEIN